MLWLETILFGAALLAALMWAGLSIYILGVERRRETTRATLASTLAGNLTIVGSVANIIVLELAGERGRIGFWRFLAYGAPVTQQEFEAAMKKLIGERWVEKIFDFWNEPVYHITENGLTVADRIRQ